MDQLTSREYQVAMLVARGLSNKEIAGQLGLSRGTVKLHVHRILQKFGVRSRYAIMFRLRFTSAEIESSGAALQDVVNSMNERHFDRVSGDKPDHNLKEQ
jgi:DNA-binding CsgD family transcriptional regulator